MKKSEFIVLRKDEQVNDLSMNELKGGLGGSMSSEVKSEDGCSPFCLINAPFCIPNGSCSRVTA